MSQANSQNIVPPQNSSHENCVGASLKGNGQGKNHVIHLHVGNTSCNSLESSPFHKRHRLNSFDSVSDDAELGAAVEEDDSGLQGSPCKVSSVNCTSHSDSIYGDSEEDRAGSFDYMPSQSHVRITHSFNPPYDEEVKIDSSTGGSSIESPRSETSVTQDEYNLAEEGTEMATLSYKETPYSLETERKHYDDCWDYVPSKKRSDDEDMEDEENERNRLRNLHTVSSFMSALPRSVSSQFDQSISYGLKQLEGNRSGHLNPRITFTSCNQYRDQYKSEDSREKADKQKNKSTDDTDKPEVSGLVDVNGNPRTLDIANNPQMRQLPRGKPENAALGSLAIPQSHSSSIADTNTLDRKKERKRMKLERQKWTPAEAYEDHKEFRDIKDILDFVEGGPISSSKAEGKQVKKKQERSRKKDHHLNGTITFENTAGGEEGPNPAESVAIAATGRTGLDAMGNSSVKPVGETKIIPRTDSVEDIFDKDIDFHDCLNTLPTKIVISSTVDNEQQRDSFECIQKCSSSDEADKNDSLSKIDDFTDEIITDKSKILSKKSAKPKSKNDNLGSTKENGLLSLKVNMVKSKEGLDMKDVKDSFLVKSVPTGNSNSFHSASDTEIPPENKREDSFTEVKKRKKRIVSVHHSSSASTYRVHNSSGHAHRNNPRPRPVTPPLPPMMRMITSVGNSRSLPVTDQTHSSRDLSPSAFPVLLGHSPLTPHADNRRNSCGDLSSDFIDSKTYDSDRESAKSLPDAHRTRIGGDLSPSYPMSYARIAAAPRRNDCTNSPSSESGVASGSQNSSVSSSVTHTPGSSIDIMSPQSPSSTVGMSDRKATVWKGSPRERRHSIGSGPEDKAEKEKSGVAQCSRQCGSQEVLSRDSIVSVRAGSADTSTPPLPAEVIHNSESTNSLQSDLDIQEAAVQELENLVYHRPKHSAHPAQAHAKAPVQKLSSKNNLPNNTSSLTQEMLKAEAGQQNKQAATFGFSDTEQKVASNVTTSDPTKANNEMPHDTAAVSSVVRSIPTGDCNVNNPSSKDKIPCNSFIAKKTGTSSKSVIFLDKRFSSSPQNLGITFGFDSSYESVCESASQSASQCQQPSKPQIVAVSSLDTAAGLLAQHVCPRQAHIPPTDSTALISSDHPCCHTSSPYSDNSNLVPKGPHIQGLRNGLILPSSAAENTVVLHEHNVSCSISDSSENAVTNLASSNRTSLSKLQPEAQADHRTSSSSVLSREFNNLVPVVPNGSLAQTNKPTPHITTGTACVAATRANPVDVIYSPNHPPPPLPPRMVTVTGDRSNTSNSTSSLPSRHDSIPESVQSSRCTESSIDKLTANNMPPATGEAVDAENAVEINKALPLQSKTEAVPQKQSHLAAPAEIVHFVYGEKIKPATGCGKLMFVLNNISQMSKDRSAEAASFLRKKWLDGVSHTGGSNAFATLNQD